MNELEQIFDIIHNYPKHFSQFIKKDALLANYIYDNKTLSSAIYAEEIYSAITSGKEQYCVLGNTKKFKSIKLGYGFCGRANVCDCVKKSVSKNVTDTKSKFSNSKNEEINKKRQATNIAKYGISNVGQLEQSVKNHQLLYDNKHKVSNIMLRIKQTKIDNWGDPNYNNGEQISASWHKKTPSELDKINKQRLESFAKTHGNRSSHLLVAWYDRLTEFYKTQCSITMLTSRSDYMGVSNQQYYDFKCNVCSHEFATYIDNGKFPRCKKCNPAIKSQPEQDIHQWLVDNNICHEMNNRTVLSGKELDVYIPEKKIAIEYCGLYWHSDIHSRIDKYYHSDKWEKCKAQGIQLITIFSDQWIHRRDIVLNRLSVKLRIHSKKLGARQTTIRTLSKVEEKTFFNNNHIQGHNPSRICYGLIKDGKILAAMSFKKVRYHSKDLTKDDWELLRLASTITVIGGASRLFNHFVKSENPNKIVSYSDNDWNTGSIYNRLGFDFSRQSGPSYWYADINKDKRYHRFNFKKKPGDTHLPENQRVFANYGYLRFWDTGNTRWVWTRTNPLCSDK